MIEYTYRVLRRISMSDVDTTSEGTTVPKKNPHKEAVLKNINTFLIDNKEGTAVYLGGQEKDGKVVIPTTIIRNAINGNAIRGTNQLLLQNYFKKEGVKTNEVITFEQAEVNGLKIKKGSKNFNITIKPSFDEKKQEWAPNIIKEFPVTSCFSIGEDGKPKAPNGEIAFAKLNSQRFSKIMRIRSELSRDGITPEKKDERLKAIAYEHKKQIEFLSVTNGDVTAYKEKSVSPEESKMLESIMPSNAEIPTLSQQKGRAVTEVKRNEEYLASHKSEKPVIDATNTTSPADYLGKYLAACSLEADFITDKDSQNTVQNTISQNLQNAIDNDNFEYLETFSAECSERCRAVCSEFRSKSYDQQRGRTPERELIQERPEQTVDAISL